MKIIEKLNDLIIQATTERSHYYVRSVCEEAVSEIDQLEKELQETKAQLEKAEKLLSEALSIQQENFGTGSLTHLLLHEWSSGARQYFKDKHFKDKQGSEK